MPVYVYGPRDKSPPGTINTTSRSDTWSRGLSPFFCGPVDLYHHRGELLVAQNVENAWQNLKVYPQHDTNGQPNHFYWSWARKGWASKAAIRYPMGKGAIPLYSWWAGQKYDYIEARKHIYIPLYTVAVIRTLAFQKLREIYAEKGEVHLWDFDGYNHIALNMSYQEVIECRERKMGHAFVLAMLLTGEIDPIND